ncbi:MAG: hypothetical protein BM485_08985 [Desulfobulbaceae bacterium DB1]|nr:MAG: hypothetical protein BM485_08985 [Desulfobulbaceae bacterium DB1]
MRLKSLDLKAFGPFTNRTLEFDSREPGLHIIFGANEAGKSSSLRALKALLYGFHVQTPDNFIHSYDQLLVGGCLENKDGNEIFFQRRKKRVGDLLDAAGNPMDPDALATFLHGVEPAIFESLYGIDHNRLVEGGNEILSQKGEIGQALFAAGAGLSSLKAVIDQLEQEAAGLFKSAGQLPEINKSIKQFKELQREAKEASLSSKEWKDLQEALKEADSARARLEDTREDKNKELRRLERLKQAIPELAELKMWRERLGDLGEVISLPPDIREKHHQVEQAVREARIQLQNKSDRLQQLGNKRKDISLNRVLLENAELVDDFHQRLGEYRKGRQDRPERNGMRINLRKEAAQLLKQIRPDLSLEDVEQLRPMLIKKRTVQELSARFAAIHQHEMQAKKQRKAAEQELQEVRKALEAMPVTRDTHDLNLAVKPARKAGDIDGRIDNARNTVEQGKKECLAELKRIGHWSGELSALMELPLPLSETVRKFEQGYSEIRDERRVLEKDRKNSTSELKSAMAELKKLEYAGEVLSENDLTRTRENREQGWRLLRRQWLDNEDVSEESRAFNSEKPLPEAYEGLVHLADVIADKLRNEADRVAGAANLKALVDQHQEKLAECEKEENDLDQRAENIAGEWSRIWEPLGIKPLSPKEMSGWLNAMEKLRYRVGDLLKKTTEIATENLKRGELRQKLFNALEKIAAKGIPGGDALGPILVFSEDLLEEIARQKTEVERLQERQKEAKKIFDRSEGDLTDAQDSRALWKEQWEKALSGLGLQGEISVHEANDYFDTLQNCLDKVKEAGDLRKRIEGIDRDADELKRELQAVLRKVDPLMLSLPLDQAILQLKAALARALKDSIRHDQLTEELEILQDEVSATEKILQAANEQRAELMKIAKCEKAEELGGIIGRFEKYRQIQEKISVIEATLAKIGAGAGVDELTRQAADVDADELSGHITSLHQELEEKINPAINQISQEIGEINTRLKSMDGSAKAAEARERMERELARMRRLVERFTRVKLASRILQQEIERYREENQDPVMQIAGRYFEALTLRSFAGLKADVDDKGEPILVGIRPDGRLIKVEGMSDGTRDQLYLALRLATLEWRMKTSEPMPFIVDDILINFDDDRARATLKVLADLGKKNQVILFTHHRQIVEEAGKLGGKAGVEVHEL